MKHTKQIHGKPVRIYAEILEETAVEQFKLAMSHDAILQWALMPDAHTWYSLPIWWVVSSKDVIFPSFVWYDIWCWMSAVNLWIKKSDIEPHKEVIFSAIYDAVPTWFNHNKQKEEWGYSNLNRTNDLDKLMDDKWLYQLATLWGGNHFIEIAYDENDDVWCVIHSWSRWVWHSVASKYMKLASYDEQILKNEFKQRNMDLYKYNEEKYNKNLVNFLEKCKANSKAKDWNHWLSVLSDDWKNYINDLNFCLEFALENRKRMIERVAKVIISFIKWKKEFEINDSFVNRNHNHAELKQWLWIHRKWATHAEEGMMWVIPWNMRDWSFIVIWKWNSDSLCSSSHGAWRILSRSKASNELNLEDFKDTMSWITAKVAEETKDESPFAYKDIFEVMELQKDLVEVKYHLKPIINIKA